MPDFVECADIICSGRRVFAAATGNPHKVDEIHAVLSPLGIDVISASAAGAPEGFDPDETGLTFEENSLIKAEALAGVLFGDVESGVAGGANGADGGGASGVESGFAGGARGAWPDVCGVIADDSGLCVDALDGAPGVISARYAGSGSDSDNLAKLLEELESVPEGERRARFVCVMTLITVDDLSGGGAVPANACEKGYSAGGGRRQIVCRGECEGYIVAEPRGKGGFGYDPVFVPDAFSEPAQTFAEISPEEKNSVSHRAVALKKLYCALSVNGEI
jgi:XTP/dITP diphosphohydrolase